MYFSVIIPVYNRPNEVSQLLDSLCQQTFKDFEVIIVEDGSTIKCEEELKPFRKEMNLSYHYQENAGQGMARNAGMGLAMGDYFVFFDSDCIIPPRYLEVVRAAIESRQLDAHGGPDDAGRDFTHWQKAMSYSMTSLFTTGGIRGKMSDPKKYQARGYNMGISRKVYEHLGGFLDPNRAEDIEFSMRIKKAGYNLELIPEAVVLHKRKNTLASFFRQSYQFGRNRAFIRKFHSDAVKLVHLFPLVFLLATIIMPFLFLLFPALFGIGWILWLAWVSAILVDAGWKNASPLVAIMALITSHGQLWSYGVGIALGLMKGKA
jgi:glycosyltransferase involved in cell wall biosynthesis